MTVGYISAVYMYTTEKFPAANSLPSRAIVVLTDPSSRSPATVQETPVTRRQLKTRCQVRGERGEMISVLPDKERFPAPDINKKRTEKIARNLEIKCFTLLQLTNLLPPQRLPV